MPASFVASGVLFLCEWLLRSASPAIAAVVVYLHISGAGPLLASGFWLIASERFDPRTAKKRFGQIAGAGTLGGLLSALLAERVAARVRRPGHAAVPRRSPVPQRVAGAAAGAANRRRRRSPAPDRRRPRAARRRAPACG